MERKHRNDRYRGGACMTSPALWAGIECTYNRVGDTYYDQVNKNGHHERIEDLAVFADLGIERIRYPCLWEKVNGPTINDYNWKWLDERIDELQRLKLEPIAGFLHHGSGPPFTALIDPEFSAKFVEYVQAFVDRYPHIRDFTPINEPLTTARFSGLYGIWYPHHKSDQSFARALFNQVQATIMAMETIRRGRPDARLIQTEDLGRASSTSVLSYQREFENERRWLSFDLLSGLVDIKHPLYKYLIKSGLTERELGWLQDHACPPDVIGVNHYLLSNRFLDHRVELYPPHLRGGNGRHRYADAGAIDVGQAEPPSPESIFQETWERYKTPIAVTEVHLSGPREAQMRWLHEIWSAAVNLNSKGGRVDAVTAWGLLGHFDWNSLCVDCKSFYESGVYDVRAPKPRPTALAEMIKSLAKDRSFDHPLIEDPGWWRTPKRILFAPPEVKPLPVAPKGRPVVITGARGTLGRAFARLCDARGIPYRILSRAEMDVANLESVRTTLNEIKPWAVINATGYVKVDLAETEQDCAESKVKLITFSSDLVFNGELSSPYMESHPVQPLNVYGRTKAESEQRVLKLFPEALIIRTSSFFGPWDEHNFITQTLRSLMKGDSVHAASDVRMSPTYIPDLVNACIDLAVDGEKGLLHITNQGETSWSELAKKAAILAIETKKIPNLKDQLIIEKSLSEMNLPAVRPRYSAMSSERIKILPTLDDALVRYFKQIEIKFEGVFV
jgi:dTDP-4-dehydrorhamnose reductase